MDTNPKLPISNDRTLLSSSTKKPLQNDDKFDITTFTNDVTDSLNSVITNYFTNDITLSLDDIPKSIKNNIVKNSNLSPS